MTRQHLIDAIVAAQDNETAAYIAWHTTRTDAALTAYRDAARERQRLLDALHALTA